MTHFNASIKDFLDCEALFHSVARPTTVTDAFASHLPVPLWGYRLAADPSVSQPESPWQYQTNWYSPMLALHRVAMAEELRSDACAQRLVGQFAATPRTLREAYSLLLPCQGNNEPNQTGLYLRGLDSFASFTGTFSHVANPALVSEIGRLMLFASPFKELTSLNSTATLTLPSKPDLGRYQVPEGTRVELIQRYGAMTNILDITLAQQTVLSGPLAVRFAVDTLRAANYGFDRKESMEMSRKWRTTLAAHAQLSSPAQWTYAPGSASSAIQNPPQEMGKSTILPPEISRALQGHRTGYENSYLSELKSRSKDGYCPASTELASPSAANRAAVIVCLMDWHPQFAHNVGLALFTDAIRAGGYDLELVNQWLRKDSQVLISQAVPGLPLVRTGPLGESARWGLKVLHPDGREIFLPVPSVAQIEHGTLAYTPTSYPLQQLRELLLDRAMALEGAIRLPSLNDRSDDAQLLRAAWARTSSQIRAPDMQ